MPATFGEFCANRSRRALALRGRRRRDYVENPVICFGLDVAAGAQPLHQKAIAKVPLPKGLLGDSERLAMGFYERNKPRSVNHHETKNRRLSILSIDFYPDAAGNEA